MIAPSSDGNNQAHYQADGSRWHRDLEWVLDSPLLVNPLDYAPETPCLDLATLDIKALEEAISSQKSRFLGPYFETLWRYAIEHSHTHTLIAHGLQVIENGRTLGEFDFIMRHLNSGRWIHQEIAVKYYLGVPLSAASPPHSNKPMVSHAWFGPNSIDRLDLKLAKMLDQQAHLSDVPEALSRLHLLGMEDNRPAKQILVKGYLFQPLSKPLPLPPHANPGANLGRWLQQSELNQVSAIASHWAILPKLQWLSPAVRSVEQTLDFTELERRVRAAKGHPLLVAALKESSEGPLMEFERFFVVSDQWQQKAEHSLDKSPLTAYA